MADELRIIILEMDIEPESAPARIRLTVDTPEGVTIGAITRLTKALQKSDDLALALGRDDFKVEVSSPGERFGLRQPWQFPRHLGKSLKVRLKGPAGSDTVAAVVAGVLEQVVDGGIVLAIGSDERTLNWNDIEQAVVITDW